MHRLDYNYRKAWRHILHPTEQVIQYAVHSSLVTACFSVTAFDLKAFLLTLIKIMRDTIHIDIH